MKGNYMKQIYRANSSNQIAQSGLCKPLLKSKSYTAICTQVNTQKKLYSGKLIKTNFAKQVDKA